LWSFADIDSEMRSCKLEELPRAPVGVAGWPWDIAQEPNEAQAASVAMPKISVVTPSFNQGAFLEETIRSVLLQAYPSLEYIVIDGASTDDSVAVIKKYESHLAFWVSEPDNGQAEALNKGFALATGEIFCFLNSDDLFLPGALFAVASAFVRAGRPANALICGEVIDFNAQRDVAVFRNASFGRLYQWLDGGTSLHQPGTFWSSALFLRDGPFPVEFRYMFDRYFYTKLAFRGVRVIHVSKAVARFRLHGSSKTVAEGDRFQREWTSAAVSLRHGFAFRGQLFETAGRKVDRFSKDNWGCASLAASNGYDRVALRALLTRLQECPIAIFHRPVASALVRCVLRSIWGR
jgi:glycosyltransferase involved in cell wall biosynthesis